MLTKLRTEARKPSPAFVVAVLALFVALGGTSIAAIELARNSVLSKHIKNGQVKRADLAGGAVNSAKVANGSLLGLDFAPGQLPKGDKGDNGDRGVQGPPGVAVARESVPTGTGGPYSGGATLQTVATLSNLPAGSYVFVGYANLRASAPSATGCLILDDSDGTGNARQYIETADQYVNVAPSGAWTTSSTSDVTMKCTVFTAATTWYVESPAFTAIPVTGVLP